MSTARGGSLAMAAAALLAGALAWAASCVVAAPVRQAMGLGAEFAAMATDPLGWNGPFPHRVLGPLLAALLGLGGDRYWLFAHAASLGFVAMVAAVVRRGGAAWPVATLLAFAVACTGAVEVGKTIPGYPEPLAFALLLASTRLLHLQGWFWAVQFLLLLNHEGALFLWPWLCWQKANASGLRRSDLAAGALVLGSYLAFRHFVLAQASQPVHEAALYAPGALATVLGSQALAAMSLVVYHGPLPILLVWHASVDGSRRAGVPILLVLLPILAMCAIATDLPRFLGYAALPIAIAAARFAALPGSRAYALALGIATPLAVVLQRPLAARYIGALEAAIRRGEGQPVPAAVVAEWPMFAGYAAVLVGMVLAGRWLAGRLPARAAL
jgi:hypothetical protein